MGILILALAAQTAGNVYNMGAAPDRIVVLEAEGAGEIINSATETWTQVNGATPAPNAAPAGFVGAAMACLPNNGGGNDNATTFVNGPRLNFRVLFRQAGTFYVWVRGRGYNTEPDDLIGENDSCHIALNGVASPTGYRMSGWNATEWRWIRTREGGNASFSVPSVGVHTFSLIMREDGFMVDRILITANANYGGFNTPTINGPAVSGQIADLTPGPATPPAVVGGSFRIDVSWNAVTNADTYLLERAPSGTNDWVTVFDGAGLSYAEDPMYDTTTTWCYRVRGVEASFGRGAVSDPPSCGTANLPPPRTAGDNDEGFLDGDCACGASAAPYWALGLLAPLLLLLRRR